MQSNNNSNKSVLNYYLISCGVAAVVSVCSAAIFAMLMTFFSINANYSALFSTLSYMFGCFVGGLMFGKMNKNKGLLFGSAIGCAVFFISLLIALVINKSSLSLITLFHFLACVLSASIGGIIAVNNASKNKYKTGKY